MSKRRAIEESADLISEASDWGTTVSEMKPRKSLLARGLLVVAFGFLALGSVLILPVIAGTLFFSSNGAVQEIAIVGFILALAFAFKKKSHNQPRNAMQIDYRACELRLGAELSNGAFYREQVISFRDIKDVSLDLSKPSDPALRIRLASEFIDMRFYGADEESLNKLVVKIMAARESALRAPVRSRIQSRMLGFEASFREAKQRIRTKIVTRTATS